MEAPQIVYIVLASMSLGIHLVKHGEDRNKKYDFWGELIGSGIIISILYWGGFFN